MFFEGRFDAAERELRGRSDSAALLLRSRCLLEGGRVGALRAGLRHLESSALDPGERREIDELRHLCRSADGPPRSASDSRTSVRTVGPSSIAALAGCGTLARTGSATAGGGRPEWGGEGLASRRAAAATL